ncbi:MAG: hypothetical protein ACK5QW_10300 [Cyanobacteriota bacterium]|jgi:hypothetical protein
MAPEQAVRLLALPLLLACHGLARAADLQTCRQLRERRNAITTAALEREMALVRATRFDLCPTLAERAELANARNLRFAPIDDGAWSRCRLQAEQRLASCHPVLYRNWMGFPFYTPEGAGLAGQADGVAATPDGSLCK